MVFFLVLDAKKYVAENLVEEVKKLIDSFPRIVYIGKPDNYTLLLYTAEHFNNPSMVKLLISHGSHVEAQNYVLQNCYHLAAAQGHHDVLHVLCKHNDTHINSKDKFHQTPLYYAAFHGNIECVKILLRYKADIRITNQTGDTAYDVAGAYERGRKDNRDIIRTMIKEHQ